MVAQISVQSTAPAELLLLLTEELLLLLDRLELELLPLLELLDRLELLELEEALLLDEEPQKCACTSISPQHS